jgi:V8-like Glu-specific endopeptidase
MSILGPIAATEERYRQRLEERQSNLNAIQQGHILTIAANTPDAVRRRMQRLHADPDVVLGLQEQGLSFDPEGPGQSPRQFPRSLERVLDTNDLMGLRFFEQGLRVSRAVGRIQIRNAGGEMLAYGTGFLVSPRLLLTNHHVLPSAEEATRSTVEFNYQESASGEIQASKMFALAPKDLFLSDEEHDYALVAVAPDPALAAYGWLPLIEDAGKLLIGETVNIIQHPNGEPKQLAIRNNQVVDELELFLHYQTDTDPGSSGSPVFNDQWEVVALHHSGVPKRNEAGEVVTVDGRVWQEWMGEQRVAWLANEGVRVSRLVRHIRSQELPAEAEPLRQELLQASQPPLESAVIAGPPAPIPSNPSDAASNSAQAVVAPPPAAPPATGLTAAGGVASWTIPLQLNLSVTLGVPTAAPGTAAPGTAAPGGDAGGVADPGLVSAAPPSGVPNAAAAVSESAGGEAPVSAQREQEFLGLFGRPSSSAPRPQPPAPTAADFRLDSLERPTFDWQTALSLALASQLSYSQAAEVQLRARAWGFHDCRFLQAGAAQGFLASTASLVLVAFRGTESTADWLSNLKVHPQDVAGLGRVHAGFWGQFSALRPQLEALLQPRRSLPILVTGHSLGGAIALLAAATWAPARPLRAVYTYGQPAVALDDASKAIGTALAGRHHRLVNDADIVPRVPPGYRHSGHLLQFDDKGRVKDSKEATGARESSLASPSNAAAEAAMLSNDDFLALQQRLRSTGAVGAKEGFTDLISDHMIHQYLQQIRKQLG